jgi:uncharacterized protein
MQDRITEEKIAKYLDTTKRALDKIKVAAPPRSFNRKMADSFLEMANAYFSDAKHFRDKGDYVNAFACVNYAHGWLDAGARIGLFEVGEDDRLFTLYE